MKQRTDETKEEFMERRLRKHQKRYERTRRLFDTAPEPRDLYSDVVSFHEDRGILRMEFRSTRPGTEDAIGPLDVTVARVSFHFKMFRYYFDDWLKSEAGRDAASE